MILERLQKEFGDTVEVRPATPSDAVDGVATSAIAAPRNEEAAQALVKWCGQNDAAFMARGGGTKLHIGAPPARCDLLISTEHLQRVVEHDEGNATVQAESGIALETLNATVGERKQFVPLDWSSHQRATLGGVVASNFSGATKLRYGTPRDMVVGLHAVLSDGRLVKAGSKVVKNVSGYDLNKLFIGSFGTLGLITQVTIRLRPQDAVQQRWSRTFSSWQKADEAAQVVFNGAFEPALLRVTAQAGQYLLEARFDGSEASVQAQLQRLPETDQDSPEASTESQLELRAQLPLARAGQWARRAEEAGASKVLWDCGLGAVHALWESAPEAAAGQLAQLRTAAQESGGTVVVERAPVELKTADLVWGAPRGDFSLMQRLKNAYDAAHVCSPGRFVGGI